MDYTDFMFSWITTSFLVGITTLYILGWYFTKQFGYWAERGVPFIKPKFSDLWENKNKTVQDIDAANYQKYGPVYGHFELIRPVLSVGDPELLRDIMVKDFQIFASGRTISVGDEITEKMLSFVRGEDWKRIRSIVTQTFTTGKIKRMINIFKESSKTLVNNFQMAAEKGDSIELKRIYGAFSMDVIASAAFSTKIDSHNDPNNKFVKTARETFKWNINWRLFLLVLFPGIMTLFGIKVFSPKGQKFFTDVTLQIMEERKRTGQKRNDFLQLLMDSAEEAVNDVNDNLEKEKEDITENYRKIDCDQVIKNPNPNKRLSFNELVAQCVSFFVAGYDTTASTLSLISYSLALNQDIQEKLIQEVDKAVEENNGELTYEAIQSMKYLDNVIAETLRMYPPAIRTERVASEDYCLGKTGITVPTGMIVTIPTFSIHRDPQHYPDPEKFDPDRFKPEERAKRHQYAYLPFGIGPRSCVAMRFALVEVKVCLAEVLRNFRIRRCPQTKVPLEFYVGHFILKPKAIIVQMEIRKDSVKIKN